MTTVRSPTDKPARRWNAAGAVPLCPRRHRSGPERADELARKTRTFVARQWSGAEKLAIQNPTPNSWDNLIQRLKTFAFSVSGMAFQDVWNLDIERLKNCCIHVVSPEGKLIPFCAYNLTDKFGHAIYRRGR